MHNAIDEFDGRLLLEAEAVANAVAGIDQDGETQRQIGFGGEFLNRLCPLAFENFEIALVQVSDEAAFLIGDGEEHVDAGHVNEDAGGLIVGRNRGGGRSWGLGGPECQTGYRYSPEKHPNFHTEIIPRRPTRNSAKQRNSTYSFQAFPILINNIPSFRWNGSCRRAMLQGRLCARRV